MVLLLTTKKARPDACTGSMSPHWCHRDAASHRCLLCILPAPVLTSSSRRRDSSWYLSLNSGLNFWSRSVSTFFKSSWASFLSF